MIVAAASLCLATMADVAVPTDSTASWAGEEPVQFAFDASAAPTTMTLTQDSDEPAEVEPQSAVPAFGASQSLRWNLFAGGGHGLRDGDRHHVQFGAGVSYFIVEDLSLDAEFNLLYVDQSGGDAWGGNLNLLFRYHLIARETWSFYVDAGAGVVGFTDKVPSSGTQFNFTPQAGAGFSVDVGNNARLMAGARWHHISNASLHRDNPGRDSVLGYVGLSFPY